MKTVNAQKLVGKHVSIKAHGDLEIIGKLLNIDSNAIVENDNQVTIVKGGEIRHVAVVQCPYYARNHNPNDFCTLMKEVCEQATENATDFESCLTFKFRERYE